jgi:segregation and condensation protein A
MAYEVHLDVFDGPFELLLQLITAQQVDLYEVSLTAIIDGYLAEVARLEHLDLEVSTEFLLIAATLVELKCRRLLPGPDDIELDEDLSLLEARDYLLARLLECRTFAGAAGALAALEQVATLAVARRAGPDDRFECCAPDLLAGVSPADLAEAARRAFAPKPVPPGVEVTHVIDDEVSVVTAMEDLVGRLRDTTSSGGPAAWLTFRRLTEAVPSTAYKVACFLAVLELYKQSLVELDQAEIFGELQVRWAGGDEAVEVVVEDDYDQLAVRRGAGMSR